MSITHFCGDVRGARKHFRSEKDDRYWQQAVCGEWCEPHQASAIPSCIDCCRVMMEDAEDARQLNLLVQERWDPVLQVRSVLFDCTKDYLARYKAEVCSHCQLPRMECVCTWERQGER